jgi:hypothetical protein
MTASRLLRLYPRAWRDRYADEFLEMVGPERLQVQQIIDIVSGAIDAWLSSDVRGATRVPAQGGNVMVKSISVCSRNQARYTARDGLIGGAVMIAGSLFSVILSFAAQQAGWRLTGQTLLNSGFLVSMMLSTPFWLMKGQPRRAQAVIIGGTITILLLINVLAVAANN